MPDYYSRFVMGLLGSVCFGLLFELGFRRSKANHLIMVLCFVVWTI